MAKSNSTNICAGNWTILFSHPGDFTPVCTTELGKMAQYSRQFYQRGVKLLGLSCDDLLSHYEWIKDIESYTPGAKVNYPIMADPAGRSTSSLTWWTRIRKTPVVASYFLGLFMLWVQIRRNMDEVPRVLESLQKASKFKVATPANWKPGDPVVISPGVTNEQAKDMFPLDLPSKKEYVRFTKV